MAGGEVMDLFDATPKHLYRVSDDGLTVDDVYALLDYRPAWQKDAACRGMDKDNPDLFFPGRGGDINVPLKICGTCPVQEECGKAGMNEWWGIWGGMTGRQRIRRNGNSSASMRRNGTYIEDPQDTRIAVWRRERRVRLKEDGWCSECIDGRHDKCRGCDCAHKKKTA